MFKFTLLCAVLAIDALVRGCDNSNCLVAPKNSLEIFYEEIGCTAVKDNDGYYFDCPERPVDGKCHFNGKSYNVGEIIPEHDQPICLHTCKCLETDKTQPIFRCVDVECPEYFRPELNRIIVKELGKCCGISVTNAEELAELAWTKCYVEDKKYVKGEIMTTDCHACICSEDFDNSTISNNHNCEKYKCKVDLHHAYQIDNGCIPIFHEEDHCCPFNWRCPDPADKILRNKPAVEQVSGSKLTCNFGNLKLNIGDELNNLQEGVTCGCVVPPMPHCVASHY